MKVDVVLNGEVVQSKDLGEGSWKIGRASECDIQLKSAGVSKQHALLVIKDNRAAIVDLGSSNGVFVNGILVRKQRINPGDDVKIVGFSIRVGASPRRERTSSRIAPPSGSPPGEGGPAFDGNAAINLNYEAAPGPVAFDAATPAAEAPPQLSPQEKLLTMMDQKVLLPFYGLMKTADWRWILSSILLSALVLSVLLSVIPIVRWGKTITTKEALARAHVVIGQAVRENYRVLTKTNNDYTRLTTEACEAEKGILSCNVVDPKTSTVLAPAKNFNKSITDIYNILAVKRVVDGKEDPVSVQKDDTTWVVAAPIYLFSQEQNDRVLTAVVVAEFEVAPSITSTFEPMVEAALFSVLLSLLAFFLISKMVTHPVQQMQEQLDAALKGEDVTITAEAKFSELESLAANINFAISRLKQAQGGSAAAISNEDPEVEDAAYVKAVEEFDAGSSDGVLLLDKDNKVRFVGHILEEVVGLRNQYAQGQNISDACRDPLFAGTAIDMGAKVISTLGEPQGAQLDINGINRQLAAVGHKSSNGEIRFVVITMKMGAA